jgi:DNA-binding NtrC family response regulator
VAGQGVVVKTLARIPTSDRVDRRSQSLVSVEEAIAAIAVAGGNKSEAAKSLRISRQALYRLLANGPDRPAASR